MPEPRLEARLDARLVRVDFPGVEIEHGGLAIELVDAAHAPVDHAGREQAQVAAACNGQGHGLARQVHVQRGQGELADGATLALDVVGEAFGAGDAVVVVVDGENARIVGEAFLDEDVQGPQGLACDGITRGAVAQDRTARDVFEGGLGQAQVLAEGVGTEIVDKLVPKPVAGHLVTGVRKLSDQHGETLSHPAEHKERGLEAVLLQQVHDPVGIVHDPGRIDGPIVPIHHAFKGCDLEIVFDIYSQSILHFLSEGGKLLKNPFWTALLPDFGKLM